MGKCHEEMDGGEGGQGGERREREVVPPTFWEKVTPLQMQLYILSYAWSNK